MAVTQEFKQAVLQNNNLKTKIMLKDSLLVDTSFNQFDEMLRYAESKLMDFGSKMRKTMKYCQMTRRSLM